jgi:predicted DNA-binding protein with PD1-like motif
MDYRHYGDAVYIRVDKDEEIVSSILDVCAKEGIKSATFSGIGGCGSAEIQVFDPDAGTFSTERHEGVLELVSLNGNVVDGGDDGTFWHAHALFSFSDGETHCVASGHLKSAVVRYTAEIDLRPVVGGVIGSAPDPVTGTRFWSF